jgi:hypothetical protein
MDSSDPPALAVSTANQQTFPIAWHAQQDVARGPVGTPLLGMVRLPPEAMPITVSPAGPQIDAWPSIEPEAKTLEDLSRLRLYRLAGLASQACHPDDFLAVYANAGQQARGARLLADLCGGGFSRPTRLALAEEIARQASSLPTGEDRYDARRIFGSSGRARRTPPTTKSRQRGRSACSGPQRRQRHRFGQVWWRCSWPGSTTRPS